MFWIHHVLDADLNTLQCGRFMLSQVRPGRFCDRSLRIKVTSCGPQEHACNFSFSGCWQYNVSHIIFFLSHQWILNLGHHWTRYQEHVIVMVVVELNDPHIKTEVRCAKCVRPSRALSAAKSIADSIRHCLLAWWSWSFVRVCFT